ncbi:hypothetical protein I3Y_28375 (plasmid) [Escherichia coli O145 str. RM9872]|uniref:Uncharacterized protein n=1 Tax=Escherichia coli O145:NM TaxID=991919 RepID=A0A4P8CCM3_ECOLX
MTDLGGKTCIFSHPVYLFLREFSLQDSRGGSEFIVRVHLYRWARLLPDRTIFTRRRRWGAYDCPLVTP